MGVPGTLGVLLCLLALLSPHPPGATARSLLVPTGSAISVLTTFPPPLPTTAAATTPDPVPNAIPDPIPTASPALAAAEEEEAEDGGGDEEEDGGREDGGRGEEAAGRALAALARLAEELKSPSQPPSDRRKPPTLETLLELIPGLRALMGPPLPPNRGEA